MKKIGKIIIWAAAVAIIVLAGYFTRPGSVEKAADLTSDIPPEDISTLPIFKDGLSSSGIILDELGFHSFSPDGKYFIFTGIKDSDEIPAKTYLVNLSDREVKELPGIMLRGFEDPRVIALFSGKDLVLYDVKTGMTEKITTQDNIFAGDLSTDGNLYSFNTLNGIKVYDRNKKITESLSSSQYDGATAWFSDNTQMLGWKDTGKSIFEAGNARRLGIWDTAAKTFTPLASGKIPEGPIRNATWLIPDKVARINTGWDDGSHDYLLDIKTGEVADLGETSSALMGGMTEDKSRGLFALINGYPDIDKEITASVWRGMEKVSSTNLPSGYYRENVQIAEENTLLYIRKHIDETGSIDAVALVALDIRTGTETVLKDLAKDSYSRVSLYTDHKTWVLSSKNQFFTGRLE